MRGVILLAAALLSGCVSAKTHMLDSRTAIISGRGTGLDSPAAVTQKVLRQAATEAQARGYEYFMVVDAQDRSAHGTYTTPGYANTNTFGTANCYGYSCSGSASSTTRYTPGQTIATFAPGADVTVRFLHGSEVSEGMRVWRAADILAQ